MNNVARTLAYGLLLVAVLVLLAGCAVEPPVAAAPPVIEPRPATATGETMLERYTRVFAQLQQEQRVNDQLRSALAAEKNARTAAEAKLAALEGEAAELRVKAARLDQVLQQYDGAQVTLLKMEEDLRKLRREALEEKLARVRVEQQFVALKIELVRNQRRETDGTTPLPTAAITPASGETEKP